MVLVKVDFRFLGILTLLVSVFVFSTLAMAATNKAGVVVIASGKVYAVNEAGETRKLKRRSAFFVNDLIRTEAGAKAQLRFQDGSLLSLRSETEIKIDDFNFDENNANEDASFFTLLKGGFRTITGAIGKRNPQAHRVDTPVATIGVRGTDYTAVLTNQLHVGVWQGKVTVTNQGGEIELGKDAKFNYGVVSQLSVAPEGLMKPPKVLNDSVPIERESKGVGSKPKTAESPRQTPDLPPRIPEETLPPLPEPEIKPTLVVNPPVGVIVGLADSVPLTSVRVIETADGERVLSANGLSPNQADFFTQVALVDYKRGGATVSQASPTGIDDYPVTWGVWYGNATTPVEGLATTDVLTNIENSVYWVAAIPTQPLTLASLSGVRAFNRTIGYFGDSNNGTVTELDFSLGVDLNTTVVSGYMGVTNSGDDYWKAELSGTLSGSYLDLAVTGDSELFRSDLNTNAMTGRVVGVLTGEAADGFAGGYSLTSADDVSYYTQGIFLVGEDARLKGADFASVDRVGLGVIGGVGDMGNIITMASDGSGGSPIFVGKPVGMNDPKFVASAPQWVLRQGTAPSANVVTNTTYGVSWGQWQGSADNPALKLTSPTDNMVTDPMTEFLFWVTAQRPAIVPVSGTTTYRNVLEYQGGTNSGTQAITSFYMNTTINFNTLDVEGELNTQAGTDTWHIDFDGILDNHRLDLNVLGTSILVSQADGVLSVTGSIDGVLTGPSSEAMAGIFDFQATGSEVWDIDGTFVVDNGVAPDYRLTVDEEAALDRIGLAVIDDADVLTDLAAEPIVGDASDGATDDPILRNSVLLNGFAADILRRGGTALTNQGANPEHNGATLEVSWGSWNEDTLSAVTNYQNPDSPMTAAALMRPVHWLTAVPTNDAVITALAGTFTYDTILAFTGVSTNGVLSNPNISYNVDFNADTFNASLSFEDAASNLWNIGYDGNITGAKLDANALSFSGGISPSGETLSGSVAAVFAGPNAEGIAGAFDVEDESNPFTHAEGTFVIGCTSVCPP